MVEVHLVGGLVNDGGPVLTVDGNLNLEALVEFGKLGSCAAESAGGSLLGTDVVPVALDSVDVGHLAEVNLEPFARIACFSSPVCHKVLVDSILGNEVLEG